MRERKSQLSVIVVAIIGIAAVIALAFVQGEGRSTADETPATPTQSATEVAQATVEPTQPATESEVQVDTENSDGLSEELRQTNQRNKEFRAKYPELAADPPLVCEPGDLFWFTCSESYRNRLHPKLQRRYGESGYYESFIQCGIQVDYWRTDGKHPDGEQVFVRLDCDEGEFVGPSPTPASGQ